ncbi:MAG: hypothetical protein A2341_26540 [Deltaproteobacteria bacterium RIFOXYB12_FULL_58_9]|nr:MAG: hypothetical protein A2341_26540 [Deltaproteobacteria bacterium RIFOXYB12_FULL_58_9]
MSKNAELVAKHRARLKRKGLVRVEVQVPKEDADTLRALASDLKDPDRGEAVRGGLARILSMTVFGSFKNALLAGPAVEIPIDRIDDVPRDVDV